MGIMIRAPHRSVLAAAKADVTNGHCTAPVIAAVLSFNTTPKPGSIIPVSNLSVKSVTAATVVVDPELL
jgi:hypothetical protein